MGMMLHRHSGVDDKSIPEIVSNKTEEKAVEQKKEERTRVIFDDFENGTNKRGRKRNS